MPIINNANQNNTYNVAKIEPFINYLYIKCNKYNNGIENIISTTKQNIELITVHSLISLLYNIIILHKYTQPKKIKGMISICFIFLNILDQYYGHKYQPLQNHISKYLQFLLFYLVILHLI